MLDTRSNEEAMLVVALFNIFNVPIVTDSLSVIATAVVVLIIAISELPGTVFGNQFAAVLKSVPTTPPETPVPFQTIPDEE